MLPVELSNHLMMPLVSIPDYVQCVLTNSNVVLRQPNISIVSPVTRDIEKHDFYLLGIGGLGEKSGAP